jgi:hypothetical protein
MRSSQSSRPPNRTVDRGFTPPQGSTRSPKGASEPVADARATVKQAGATPAIRAAILAAGFDPTDPGTRTWASTRSCSPSRSANASTGTNPAHEIRFGSSKPAETLWLTLAYRMSFFSVMELSTSPIFAGQEDIRLSRPARETGPTGGSRLNFNETRDNLCYCSAGQ